MHTSGSVFLDEGDEAEAGGNLNPFAWVRVVAGHTDISVFGKDAEQFEQIAEKFLEAARDLRLAQVNALDAKATAA